MRVCDQPLKNQQHTRLSRAAASGIRTPRPPGNYRETNRSPPRDYTASPSRTIAGVFRRASWLLVGNGSSGGVRAAEAPASPGRAAAAEPLPDRWIGSSAASSRTLAIPVEETSAPPLAPLLRWTAPTALAARPPTPNSRGEAEGVPVSVGPGRRTTTLGGDPSRHSGRCSRLQRRRRLRLLLTRPGRPRRRRADCRVTPDVAAAVMSLATLSRCANGGGFRGSAHHLNVRVACLAARRMKVVATMRQFGLSERDQERVWEIWGNGTSLRALARKLGARPEYVRRDVTSRTTPDSRTRLRHVKDTPDSRTRLQEEPFGRRLLSITDNLQIQLATHTASKPPTASLSSISGLSRRATITSSSRGGMVAFTTVSHSPLSWRSPSSAAPKPPRTGATTPPSARLDGRRGQADRRA